MYRKTERGEGVERIGGVREKPDFASFLATTRFFASAHGSLASAIPEIPVLRCIPCVRHQMKEVKVRFEPADLMALDHQAAMAGVSRAELIRSRALVSNCDSGLTVARYHRLVSDALANVRGDIPRRMVEQLVAYVITWISSTSQPSSNP